MSMIHVLLIQTSARIGSLGPGEIPYSFWMIPRGSFSCMNHRQSTHQSAFDDKPVELCWWICGDYFWGTGTPQFRKCQVFLRTCTSNQMQVSWPHPQIDLFGEVPSLPIIFLTIWWASWPHPESLCLAKSTVSRRSGEHPDHTLSHFVWPSPQFLDNLVSILTTPLSHFVGPSPLFLDDLVSILTTPLSHFVGPSPLFLENLVSIMTTPLSHFVGPSPLSLGNLVIISLDYSRHFYYDNWLKVSGKCLPKAHYDDTVWANHTR
jgi:hypothetical protein